MGWLHETFTLAFDWEAEERKVAAKRKILELWRVRGDDSIKARPL